MRRIIILKGCDRMDTSGLIDSLVGTYRELNMKYRTLEENSEMKAIVARMRDDEIAFSQALKDRITGVGTAGDEEKEVVDGSERTLAQVISQFGSVRATTLNLLKGIPNSSDWDHPDDDGKTVRQHIEDLVKSDATQLERLSKIAGV